MVSISLPSCEHTLRSKCITEKPKFGTELEPACFHELTNRGSKFSPFGNDEFVTCFSVALNSYSDRSECMTFVAVLRRLPGQIRHLACLWSSSKPMTTPSNCFCHLVGIAGVSAHARRAARVPKNLGGFDLCLASGSADAAHWASWGDSNPSAKGRHPDVAEATTTTPTPKTDTKRFVGGHIPRIGAATFFMHRLHCN